MPMRAVTAVAWRDVPFPSGRTCPCLLECESPGEPPFEVVAKFLEPPARCLEILGALLANYFRIRTPEPCLVSLADGLVATVPGRVGSMLAVATQPMFGSRYLRDTTTWGHDSRVRLDDADGASRVVAFDMLVEHADRRLDKPNLLNHQGRIVAIDHESAFAFCYALGGGGGDWIGPALACIGTHPVAAAILRTRLAPELDGFAKDLARLTPLAVQRLFSPIPHDLRDERILALVTERLERARRERKPFVNAVRRALQ